MAFDAGCTREGLARCWPPSVVVVSGSPSADSAVGVAWCGQLMFAYGDDLSKRKSHVAYWVRGACPEVFFAGDLRLRRMLLVRVFCGWFASDIWGLVREMTMTWKLRSMDCQCWMLPKTIIHCTFEPCQSWTSKLGGPQLIHGATARIARIHGAPFQRTQQ